MSKIKKSKIRTTELREMIISNIKNLFEGRNDFTFIFNDSKNNKIFILNEYAESNHENAYPRIVLHRNGSRFQKLGGFNDSHENSSTFDHEYTRADLNSHNFSLVVKGEGGLLTEQLGYIVSSFIRFFSKDLVFREGYIPMHEINHGGFSSMSKVEGQATERSAFQCVISFEVLDNEIFCFEEAVKAKVFVDFEVDMKMEEINCYCKSNDSCQI